MATDAGAAPGTEAGATETDFGQVSRIKGVLFRQLSAAASWIGIVALGILLAYVAYDAFALDTASTEWYALFGTLFGVPTLATVGYLLRNRAAGRLAVQTTTVLLAGVVGGMGLLVLFVVLEPATWFAYVLAFAVPTAVVAAVGFGYGTARRWWARVLVLPVAVAGLLFGAVATGGMPAADAVRIAVELLVPSAVLAGFAYAGARREALGRVGTYAIGAVFAGALVGYGLLGIGSVFALALPDPAVVYAGAVLAALLGVAGYVLAGEEPNASLVGVAVPAVLAASGLLGRLAGPPVAGVLAGPVGVAGSALGGVEPGTWTVYLLTLVVPGAALAGLAARRFEVVDPEGRGWLAVPGAVLAAALVGSAAVRFGAGAATDLWPWFFSTVDASIYLAYLVTLLTPAALFYGGALRGDRDRRETVGLAAPWIVVGAALLAGAAAKFLGVPGPESWVDWQFVTSAPSRFPERAGLYVSLIGSVFIVVLVAVFTFPLGVGAALYLEEYAPETGWGGRLTRLIQVNISNLAGVPSVVYGLLGLGLFVNLVGIKFGTVLAAALTLGLLILPIVLISAQEAIRAVPDSQRQAAYGMGATRWQTVRSVVLPRSLPGILTGTILALGRAIGETAPLIMIGLPNSIFSPPDGPLATTSAMPLQVFNWAFRPDPAFRTGVTAAGVVILLGVLLTMNSVAILVRNKYQRDR